MPSPQTLSESDRRLVAAWAADCAEHVLALHTADTSPDDAASAPGGASGTGGTGGGVEDPALRDAIERTRGFAEGCRDAAGEIRRRFEAVREAGEALTPAGAAAARAVGQASGVAHMGAHALGAAAYAAKAAAIASPEDPDAMDREISWQLAQLTPAVRAALSRLPPLGEDSSGPLGRGLLSSGILATVIRRIQTEVAATS